MPYDRHTLRNMERAYEEAKRGALEGALKWGGGSLVAFGVAQYTWPLYRNLTVPFKTFLLMSAVITGGMVNGDAAMQQAERVVRQEQRTLSYF
ncbi:hypothetical protein PYCC9005_002346 [Savitreella phatthalungensis]